MKLFVLLALLMAPILMVEGSLHAADGLAVTNAWSRPSLGDATSGVAYLTISNTGPADTMTAIDTPIAAAAALHQTRTENGVSGMVPVDTLRIGSGATVSLAPGGYHIMLFGLKRALHVGDHFPLVLHFEHAGTVETTVDVKTLGTSGH